MRSYNSSVAAILFTIAVTFAGTELFCRFTDKYANHNFTIAAAILVPFILVSVGLYFQLTPSPASPTASTCKPCTVPTRFIPPPTPSTATGTRLGGSPCGAEE